MTRFPVSAAAGNQLIDYEPTFTFTFTAQSSGETERKGSMTSPAHPSAVRVTADSFHSEWQGLATSVLGNENICTEVAVYSPFLSKHQPHTPRTQARKAHQ